MTGFVLTDFIVGTVTLSNSNLTAHATNPTFMGVALDLDNKKIWYWNPSLGQWNSSGTANPATNIGGGDITTLAGTGALFPMLAVLSSSQGTINCDGPFKRTAPSGFTAWTGNTWDPAGKGASITLTNGNLTAKNTTGSWNSVRTVLSATTGKYYWEINLDALLSNGFIMGIGNASATLSDYFANSANGSGVQSQGSSYFSPVGAGRFDGAADFWRGVAASTQARSSGKRIFELTIDAITGVVNSWIVGVADASWSASVGNYPGSAGISVGYQPNIGNQYQSGGWTLAGSAGSATPIPGAVIMVAVDFSAAKLWFFNPGSGTWSGSGNPATGLNGSAFAAGITSLFPAWGAEGTSQATLNTAGPFSNSVPSGFTAWDDGISSAILQTAVLMV